MNSEKKSRFLFSDGERAQSNVREGTQKKEWLSHLPGIKAL